ncbi:MAG: D-alanyl-D-alanine carboxypeptidase/D-alanyl-D-alanine-endopeptidase [Azoarcus sp.]|jgi:D-alanyl-D-alanine carboxypeptidase/D-alanyl-D-alanine-endopeptidase (penicillin-binding protein 4)|nr:D-alanyl-D-alanine carboxypeptidase/D-alanyl-D-alanine-endopeptidase [Azoarcus sp.]
MPLQSRRPAIAFLLAALVFTLSVLMTAAHAAAPSRLPAGVRVALERARVPESAVAIWVQPVDANRPTLSFNAERPMNPASVMKIVTTFAALEQLGPTRTWTTHIASAVPIRNGVLSGDLYLIGSGDPALSHERLWKILRRLRALGLATIDGDIVLDHSALVLPSHDPNAFDGHGLRPYNSGADGLLINFNTQQLALFPGNKPQDPVQVVEEPPLAGIVIDNQITTSGKVCDPWYRDLEARLENNRLILTGSLPASCGQRFWSAAPLAPPDFAAALIQPLWQELGGKLNGKIRHGTAPEDAQTLIADESAPLAEIARTMNKWSNNVIARQLLANLGRAEPPPPDMVAAGIQAVRLRLSEARIGTTGLVIDNGAGLSRSARIRADSLGTLLIRAWQRPWMPEFIASLPVAGLDGTAYRRLASSPARGYAHLKTGTVNHVKAIAGYVLDQYGRRHAVVMMINHPQASNAYKAQDALIEWVWNGVPVTPRAGRDKR